MYLCPEDGPGPAQGNDLHKQALKEEEDSRSSFFSEDSTESFKGLWNFLWGSSMKFFTHCISVIIRYPLEGLDYKSVLVFFRDFSAGDFLQK